MDDIKTDRRTYRHTDTYTDRRKAKTNIVLGPYFPHFTDKMLLLKQSYFLANSA